MRLLQEYQESLESCSHVKEHDIQQLYIYLNLCQKCVDSTLETVPNKQNPVVASAAAQGDDEPKTLKSTSFII